MSHVYVLTNQHQQFLSKSNEWIDGREAGRLFRSEHKDVAINQMFEANTRDVSLRIELLQCELNSKGQPQVPAEALGDPREIPTETPPEVPPEEAPEVEPEEPPEITPEEPPEVPPEEPPEISPEEPPEVEPGEDESRSAALEAG
ncbi:hypothetical protein [Microbulbifer sp.]|uniref:hypothetical protein n=1 Tax=Microbulbifer sp. TaxID=1908541 RepID=UPI003F3883AC